MEFEAFPKIARLSRDMVVTEKIDGVNAQVFIVEAPPDGVALHSSLDDRVIAAQRDLGLLLFAGSRSRYITPADDNHGFAKWVRDHAAELWALGPGRHHGEWWGSGVQRGYGLPKGEKRFSLFNVSRWHQAWAETFISQPVDWRLPPTRSSEAPACCRVVPVLHRGVFSTEVAASQIDLLRTLGSVAAPGFMKPEGILIFHAASGQLFKKTLDKDDEYKGKHPQ